MRIEMDTIATITTAWTRWYLFFGDSTWLRLLTRVEAVEAMSTSTHKTQNPRTRRNTVTKS